MILPEGVRKDLDVGLKGLAERYGVSIVVIDHVDWNDDLTPWPAVGVFKKAKPFGGKAAAFLDKLTNEIVPKTERDLGIEDAERTLLGISLSGLFAVWSAFNADTFSNIISISGSLWYDGLVEFGKGLYVARREGEERQRQKDGGRGGAHPCCRQPLKRENPSRCHLRVGRRDPFLTDFASAGAGV